MPIGKGRLTRTPKRVLGAFVLISLLCVLACGTSEIISALNVAAAATSVASTTVASVNGIDSTVQSQIVTYLTATSAALSTAATALQSGSLTNAQITSIAAALVSTVLPTLPDSVPVSLKTTLAAVSSAVQSFVTLLEQQQTSTVKSSAKTKSGYVHVKLSRRDRSLVDESLLYLVQADAALARVAR